MKTYDVIIIGAGSVGTPLALELAKEKLRVLVLEKKASAGQGQNKAAIGGVRATFSEESKIKTCQQSLEIFSTWQDRYGDDIGWQKGGYCFPAYTESIEKSLKDLVTLQQSYGLNINWVSADKVLELFSGLNPNGLLGGTFSPDDGSVSPMKAASAFYRQASIFGAEFRFGEEVTDIKVENGCVSEVVTTKDRYSTRNLVIATGADAKEIGQLAGIDLPVTPDSHEAGITEPVKKFFSAMLVDLRPSVLSKNFYFYQNSEGQIIFCLTPDPLILGKNVDSTSYYLPQVGKRLIEIMPKLSNIRVRRVWRGLYPMTPDGLPIVDKVEEAAGLYAAVGLCGHGFMMGPGLAVNLSSMILKGHPVIKRELFCDYSYSRDYCKKMELLK